MPQEYERRFLVEDAELIPKHAGQVIIQAYLFIEDSHTARIRRIYEASADGRYQEGMATAAFKGPRRNMQRTEYELEIDGTFAGSFIERAKWTIHKTRFPVIIDGDAWELDVFHGRNAGLIIAEYEAESLESVQRMSIPHWCSQEVTRDQRYNNENLAKHPISMW